MQWTMINGEFHEAAKASLHIQDLSIQRGYGVFDFFKVQDSQPLFLEDHLKRFYHSASFMHIPLDAEELLKEQIFVFIRKNSITSCGIRLTLTGGYSNDGYTLGKPNLIINSIPIQQPTAEAFQKGISLMTFEYNRQFPSVKTIDYMMAVWLQKRTRQEKADDVLYYKNDSFTECPRSNFFLVIKDGVVITPSDGILSGITRKKILELAKGLFDVQTRMITREDIHNAKEAFITSTTKIILPVNRIDKKIFHTPGEVTTKIHGLIMKLQQEAVHASA
jgi:branched-chain amino acid aminotransferase